jgi:hypothetical protein
MPDVVQTLRVLLDVNSAVNAAASLVILGLVHGLRLRLRGYVLLIYSMTLCQAIFDGGLMMLFECKQTDEDCLDTCFFVVSAAGVASQGWSLFIAASVAYIVSTRKRLDIDKFYVPMALIVIVSSIVVGGIRLAAATKPGFAITVRESIYIYDAIRYIEILVNLFAVLVIFLHLRGMVFDERESNPIWVLARKLLLYPLAQLLSRIGSTQYEDVYSVSFPQDSDGWSKKSWQAVIYSILTPLGGLLSLLIFLRVQPGAWRLFRALICCRRVPADDASRKSNASANRLSSSSIPQDVDEEDAAMNNEGMDRDWASAASLSSLHGSRFLASPETSLSTVFSAQRPSLHAPLRLADLSEEQLVEVIAQGSPSHQHSIIIKSSSALSLQDPLLR